MIEPRHVLVLQSSSELYGSGKIIHQVLQVYRSEGLIPVILLTGPGPLADLLIQEGFIVRVKNLGILRRKYVKPSGLINRLSKNIQAYSYLNQLHREFNFQLVYSNTLAVVVGAWWARRRNLPHIWHIHEILLGPSPLVSMLAKMLDGSTTEPIVVSQAVGDHLKNKLKKARPEVIYNGIPYEPYLAEFPDAKKNLGIDEEKLVITMVGRINPGKGQLFFLEMAEILVNRFPQLHFLLVGDPFPGYEGIEQEIIQKIEKSQFQKSVSYLGFRKDIPEILAATDVFVLPSILPDSFPTVILEAMASGKPVVATRSGGASEMVIHEKTGLLVSIGDVKKGAEALDKLIKNVALRIEMGNAARNRVLHEYSLEAFEEKIKNHLWRQMRKN
ncbi:MAG: glycosyltransferase family 4 protein [Algoriphagus sp.]|uniref:glycosyltransferase family 4 protein n=1 Tax=Algoriphagus sp. TaxID=1872435 RepID=UPI0026098081|nr:glycosyltransferase family 4 protein [Algoriphagus sp.]MDG1278882.1 glycosyltransferase family 4 protein [Algoriphagus sp.]